MINTKYLATYFTDLLNKAGKDKKFFKIFADEGELKKSVKEYGKQPKHFTNGIVEIISSTLTPIRGIRLNTYTAQLTLYIDLALDGFNDDKESLNLIALRDIFTKVIEEYNGSTELIEIGGKSYSQSMTIGYPTNGAKSEVGYISDCLPIYWTFNLAMFEDGINANNCKLIVNGVDIPFTRMVLTRQRTAEQDNFTGDKSSKTIMQINGLSVDIVMPALNNNEFSNLIMRDVLDGGNYALNVKIETPVFTKIFIGTLGNTQASLDIATNVGYNLSIVEAKENILDYDKNMWVIVKDHTINPGYIYHAYGHPVTVYWGDGSVEELVDGTHYHDYTDGKKSHVVRLFHGG